MDFLVVGLGSMGKRRIRCLKALGYNNIVGFDSREDRRVQAEEKYGIKTCQDLFQAFNKGEPTAMIIAVPPDVHHKYIKVAIQKNISFFVEASVVDTDMELIKSTLENLDIIAAPSATLLFHPAIQQITQIVKSGHLGKVSNIILHSGQFLPDWHTYESVKDFYVSNPDTGGGREIVPFELTWITKILGFPKRVCGNYRKTIEIEGAESIDDTYNFLMDYNQYLASVTVDVVSRNATRRLLINGDKRQLIWDWSANCVKVFDPENDSWDVIEYEMKNAEEGYNPNIGENMYIEELRCFIEAIEGKHPFVNSIEEDHRVLKLLYAIEESDRTSKYVEFRA
ncbi:MAG: Gfo/Idh/MocA family oxidoreductase [Desulfitobacterium hafniense]|nr:Gfo/Idh/MocA family oxidoreductase [Desulfitobacterium hafniense]